ncbi:MAG: lamin tail domain-containing protein [Bacteroidota bacterium]
MNYRPLFFLLLLCPALLCAQLNDDFSDGELNNNPSWMGDLGNFIINPQAELQLQAAAAGSSSLYTAVDYPDSLEWTLFFRLDFAPSASNQLRLYLQADDADLLNANGYYLEVGESGSGDALRFFRQDAGNATLLASGSPVLGSEPALARLQVRRSATGEWLLRADYNGGNNFQTEASVTDATYGSGSGFFGLYTKYTASRVDLFLFDDIQISELVPDLTAPQFLSVDIIDAEQLELRFDEALTPASVGNTANYSINNGIGQPATATPLPGDPTALRLTLASPLQSPQDYTIEVANLSDAAGNLSPPQQASFTFIEFQTATAYDILINEIMADPTLDGGATIGLPNAEYVELYNRSDKIINLENFSLADRSSEVLLPAYTLLPDSYVILQDRSTSGLSAFGDTLAVSNFPGLGNSDDDLELMNAEGEFLHAVFYTSAWYLDAGKDDGGWSLELIRPNAPCSGQANWQASVSPTGGSPGQPNSVLQNEADDEGSILLRAFPVSSNSVRLYFDESVNEMTGLDVANFEIDGQNIISATPEGPLFTTLVLQVQEDFAPGTVYEVQVRDGLTDCLGNAFGAENTTRFGLPEELEARDLVINELLYEPGTGGKRFVELYNRSAKIANLNDLIFARRDLLGQIDDVSPIESDYLLFPGEYVVVSPDPLDIQQRYFSQHPEAYVASDLPSYDSRADTVVLYTAGPSGALVIDELAYSRSFHHALLDVRRGVSLERIDPSGVTSSAANWHSAAESVGFATPTYQNSQFLANAGGGPEVVSIPNPRLSPDGDGFEDFLQINYATDQVGYTANIKIFDAEGREVRTLVRNELLAAEGSFKWDGTTADNDRARLGIYVIWIELFTPEGDTQYFKEPCVLAGQLD